MTCESVALVIEYYRPFEIGGAERSAHALARALVERGVRVVVITPNYGAPRREAIEGVEVVRLPFPQRLRPGALARRRWLANPVLQAGYAMLIAGIVSRQRLRLIHLQNSQLAIAAAAASIVSRRPLVATIRDLAYTDAVAVGNVGPSAGLRGLRWRIDARYARLERRVKLAALRRAARIVFVSRGLQDVYRDRAPRWVVDRSRVVYNIGPEPGIAASGNEARPSVLFVGKLSTGKGLTVLYDAIPEVTAAMPSAVFDFVGEPGIGWTPPPSHLTPVVRMHGRLRETEVRELMARSAVLVSPSIWPEPLSRVLLEAMSCGVAIVATPVGGTVEIVGEGAGLLVPPGDAASLAAAILSLLTDPVRRAQLGETAARRYRELFSKERVVPEILDAYGSAV